MIVAKIFTTPPQEKEESTIEELCTSYEEQLCEKKIEKDEEGISGDHYANETCIEHRFQLSVKLDRFFFRFYFIN